MIWIILAALGIPLWLVVGLLLGVLWSRRQIRRAPGIFACKVRPTSGKGSERWPRSTSYGRWVHDVLLVHGGIALVRDRALPVRSNEGGVVPAPDAKVKGGDPVSARLRLDDGTIVEVAGLAADTALLQGPFRANGAPGQGTAV